jgi:hypothetical protein
VLSGERLAAVDVQRLAVRKVLVRANRTPFAMSSVVPMRRAGLRALMSAK